MKALCPLNVILAFPFLWQETIAWNVGEDQNAEEGQSHSVGSAGAGAGPGGPRRLVRCLGPGSWKTRLSWEGGGR